MGQTGSHVEYEWNLFIKWVNRVDLSMTLTRLASSHYLFINELIVSSSRVVLDFAAPRLCHILPPLVLI